MKKTGLEIAKLLISLNCVQLSPGNPFTYASGLKGPIYCDNRKILSHVKERGIVAEQLVSLINESKVVFDQVAGLATAGIPHAAIVSERLHVPMIYVRSAPKGHGKQNQIEGDFVSGEKIILIEDLVNQGKSLGVAIDGAIGAGLVPQACFCIVDYQMKSSRELLSKYSLPLFSLTDFTTLVNVACDLQKITGNDKDILYKWHDNPSIWKR